VSTPQITGVELHPHEQNSLRAIPASHRGPGKLTGGNQITLQAWSVQLTVSGMLGPNGLQITGGYGNWQQVSVPRNRAITLWQGQDLLTADLDLLFDAWHTYNMARPLRRSVEGQCATLEKMATRGPGMLTPPSIRTYGASPRPGMRWVISGLSWGDVIRDPKAGVRMRQAVTVHLMQYLQETDVIAQPRGAATSRAPTKYKVKAGDNLKTIATRMLGKSSGWQQIAKANPPLRGWELPKSYVGRTIKVPPQ
jgi:LysM domain